MASTDAIAPGDDVRRRSQLAGLRRGLAMIGMTVVVPGSAQLAAGNRRIGRWGVRVWVALVLAGLLALLTVLLARNVVLGIFTTGWVLWLGSWVVLALGLFWSFLFLNAWWASRPREMGAVRGGILGGVAVVLAVVVATGSILSSSALRASGSAVANIFGGGGTNQQKAGRYNVLLLGSDAGNDREGTRTDSITIASIDALGGVRLDIGKRVPKGGWGAPPSAGFIEPGPDRLLTGPEALWFARDRDGSTDYARMMRQKCVMVAMLHQMDALTVATKFSQIASATGRLLVTDVPSGDVGMLIDLANKAKSLDIANVAFTPPAIAPGSANYALIRSMVVDAIKASEDLDKAPAKTSAPATTAAAGKTTSAAKATKTTVVPTTADDPANTVEDLSSICTAR